MLLQSEPPHLKFMKVKKKSKIKFMKVRNIKLKLMTGLETHFRKLYFISSHSENGSLFQSFFFTIVAAIEFKFILCGHLLQ